jgi:hypothetical protein
MIGRIITSSLVLALLFPGSLPAADTVVAPVPAYGVLLSSDISGNRLPFSDVLGLKCNVRDTEGKWVKGLLIVATTEFNGRKDVQLFPNVSRDNVSGNSDRMAKFAELTQSKVRDLGRKMTELAEKARTASQAGQNAKGEEDAVLVFEGNIKATICIRWWSEDNNLWGCDILGKTKQPSSTPLYSNAASFSGQMALEAATVLSSYPNSGVARGESPSPKAPPSTVADRGKETGIKTVWSHNGSTIGLIERGNRRTLVYLTVSPKMQAHVSSGAVLFDGTAEGSQWTGKARRFKSDFPTIDYDVQGSTDGQQIELSGLAPKRGADGKILSRDKETLRFTFEKAL